MPVKAPMHVLRKYDPDDNTFGFIMADCDAGLKRVC